MRPVKIPCTNSWGAAPGAVSVDFVDSGHEYEIIFYKYYQTRGASIAMPSLVLSLDDWGQRGAHHKHVSRLI
jgi:hypothetical protein